MNKFNVGLAPLAIVLILVVLAVVGGGGVYLATKSDSEVVTSTTTPTAKVSPTLSKTPTVSPKPVATKTSTPVPAKTTAPTAVTYNTVQEAVSSGKNVTCITAWWSEKGPDQYRIRYYINGTTIKVEWDENVNGTITISSSTTYVPGHAQYNAVLAYKLSSATCTQQ